LSLPICLPELFLSFLYLSFLFLLFAGYVSLIVSESPGLVQLVPNL